MLGTSQALAFRPAHPDFECASTAPRAPCILSPFVQCTPPLLIDWPGQVKGVRDRVRAFLEARLRSSWPDQPDFVAIVGKEAGVSHAGARS
jgi:hypothetical protein